MQRKVPKNASLETRSASGCNLHALFNKHEWLTEQFKLHVTNLTLNHKRNLLQVLKHEIHLQVNYAEKVEHFQSGTPRYPKWLV